LLRRLPRLPRLPLIKALASLLQMQGLGQGRAPLARGRLEAQSPRSLHLARFPFPSSSVGLLLGTCSFLSAELLSAFSPSQPTQRACRRSLGCFSMPASIRTSCFPCCARCSSCSSPLHSLRAKALLC